MMRALPMLALSVLCALCGSAAASAPPALDDLNEIMGLLAMRQHGRVEFIEQRFLAVLSRPIESSGELRYDAPDRLEKRTLLPHAETLVLSGGTLTMERGSSRRVIDLNTYPQIRPFIESLRATLAGDRSALERLFHVDLAGSLARWTLTLVPLESNAKQSVAQVRIDGARDQLLRVEIRQPDGDRSLMTLRPSTLP